MKRIGIDIDGVLSDFCSHFSCFVNTTFNIKLANRPTDWSFSLSAEKISPLFQEFIKQNGCWLEQRPLSYLELKVVERFAETNVIYAISDRMPEPRAYTETRLWLDRHGLYHIGLVLSIQKRTVCEALGLTHFLDDKPSNVAQFEGSSVRCFLLDQPWNREASPYLRRVHSITEFLSYITGDV